MFKEIFIIGLFAHIIGDYYLQSEPMATNKMQLNTSRGIRYYLVHIALYSFAQIVLYTICFGINFKLVLLLCFSHALIDFLKIIFENKNIKKLDTNFLYLADQLLHIIAIFIFSLFILELNIAVQLNGYIAEIFSLTDLQNYDIVKLAVIAVILHKPINITCKIVLSKYNHQSSSSPVKAGALIGTLERLIIVIMIYHGEYSAIGLIFAAKSVARYDKISRDKEFAEYYLLGTLLSVLSTIVVYGIVM